MLGLQFEVRTKQDLYALKAQSGLDSVLVDLALLKLRGLAHHAIRLAFFAVREGGQIILTDTTASGDQAIGPFLLGWPTLRALAISTLGQDCRLESGGKLGEMRFTRTVPALNSGWSAGLIFSGRDEELPAVYRCLDGLRAQPELTSPTGEIMLCGPSRDLGFLTKYPQVTYLVFDIDNESGAFPIARKKNYLLRKMKFPRRLVLHARIVLDHGSLAQAPKEFDILAPEVVFRSGLGEEPSIGLVAIDPAWPNHVPSRFERSTLNLTVDRYLDLMACGKPYVDGGAFAVTGRAFDRCQLDDSLCWGDCEDVEWCFRAQSLGLIVDLAPGMKARNTNSKVRTLEYFPRPLAHGLRNANRLRRTFFNLGRRLGIG